MDYIDSYYARTLSTAKTYPALADNIEVEICVIGGGLAGLNTALELALRGKSVAVVEANRVAWGASGRNAGFVIPSYSLGAKELAKKVGVEHAQKLQTLLNDAITTIRARINEYKIDCGPLTDGMLKLSLREDSAGLQAYRDFMAEKMGLDIEYWDHKRVREAIVSERYNDGVLYKSAFHFHSLNYARGIAEACARHGAQIFEQSPVVDLKLDQAKKIVIVENGRQIAARHVVFACSGYIGKLYRPLANAVVPVATYAMCTEPLGDRMKDVLRVPHCILDTRFANDYYRPLADTRLLWGGRVSVCQPAPSKLAKMLHHDMVQVFPQLADVKVEAAWGGLMGYPRHKMPQIGQTLPNVWHCTGIGGYGMTATTACGKAMAGAIAGDNPSWQLFKPFGLDFTGGPLIAPAVTQTMYWGYQMADKVSSLFKKAA